MSRIIIVLAIILCAVLLLWEKLPKLPKPVWPFEEPSVAPPKPSPTTDISLALKYYTLVLSPTIPEERKTEIITKLEQEEAAGYRTSLQTEEYAEWLVGVETYRATEEPWFEKAGGIF